MGVRCLDAGGIPVNNAGGLNTIPLGARNRLTSDD
jgi:hypothetical protein